MATKPELEEKDFIHEGIGEDPYPFIFWLVALVILGIFSWGVSDWYDRYVEKGYKNAPFLQVTNREFSLFLWQNPEFMRIRVSDKASYLPAFNYIENLSMKPEMAEEYVIAPLDVLFKYHIWEMLLSNEVPVQKVHQNDFEKFLSFAPEWSPEFWKAAPSSYLDTLKKLKSNESEIIEVPYSVQQAYTGWKNFFQEGEQINLFQPTYGLLRQFLNRYPHYARHYWQNLIPHYLYSSTHPNKDEKMIPVDELPSFLKSALYNYSRSL